MPFLLKEIFLVIFDRWLKREKDIKDFFQELKKRQSYFLQLKRMKISIHYLLIQGKYILLPLAF